MNKEKTTEEVYYVVYSKMGKTLKDSFGTLNESVKDYKEKRRLDKLGYFDDRFVIGIEDKEGNKVDISNIVI